MAFSFDDHPERKKGPGKYRDPAVIRSRPQQRLGHDFRSDTVARQNRYFMRFTHHFPRSSLLYVQNFRMINFILLFCQQKALKKHT